MKAVIILFDTLNRHELPAYGGTSAVLPNFERLASRSLTFDHYYAASLPCMPARRDLHTGRYNFLHSPWAPLQAFDESVIKKLSEAGIYTHLVTDHFHYWEDGGSGYMSKFDSCDMIRGQQGDPWIGQVKEPEQPQETLSKRAGTQNWRHDWINRAFMKTQEQQPQHKTFSTGLDFIERNREEDNWLLMIESFDPHEPFFVPEEWKKQYPDNYQGPNMDWPDYGERLYSEDVNFHLKQQYRALLTQCDHYLGKVLDAFDRYDLWRDTMLVVTTDHGFMLGEKGWMGKNVTPMYEEITHIPFFMYDPRYPTTIAERRKSLAQITDMANTLTEYFDIESLKYSDGYSLQSIVATDEGKREFAIFGVFGQAVCVTDGQYCLMKAPESEDNQPLFQYSLSPFSMRDAWPKEKLAEMEAFEGFSFMQGSPCWKTPIRESVQGQGLQDWLFDLKEDPQQVNPLDDRLMKQHLIQGMKQLMEKNEAPDEQYRRLGIL